MAPGGAERLAPPTADGFAQVLTWAPPTGCRPRRRARRGSSGHPEGFQEAFANLYADAAEAIVARRTGRSPEPLALDFPTVEDGARGVKFSRGRRRVASRRRPLDRCHAAASLSCGSSLSDGSPADSIPGAPSSVRIARWF